MLTVISDEQEQDEAIRVHCAWDVTSSRDYLIWAALSKDRFQFDEIFAGRLQQAPNDVILLRLEQDTVPDDQKAKVEQRHRKLAPQHPDDPDWQYIGVRAMPDSAEQDQAFVEGAKRWPDHYWFAFASGAAHMSHGRWEESLAAYDLIVATPSPLGEYAAMNVARMRRLLEGVEADFKDLRGFSGANFVWQIEHGVEALADSPVYAYYYLGRREPTKAYEYAVDTSEEIEPRLLALLAASDSAKSEWQEQAFALKPDELDDGHVALYLASLAWRLKNPHQEYLDRLEVIVSEKNNGSPSALMPFLSDLMEHGPDIELEEKLTGLDANQRGLAFAATVVMYPKRAPWSWRESARRLLFATERPYFKAQ